MSQVKIPLSRYAAEVKGTKDEVFIGPLRAFHKMEKHTKEEWSALVDRLRSRPVKLEA